MFNKSGADSLMMVIGGSTATVSNISFTHFGVKVAVHKGQSQNHVVQRQGVTKSLCALPPKFCVVHNRILPFQLPQDLCGGNNTQTVTLRLVHTFLDKNNVEISFESIK